MEEKKKKNQPVYLILPIDTNEKIERLQARLRLHGEKKTKNTLILEFINEGLKHYKLNSEQL